MTNKAITIVPIDDTDINIIRHIAGSLEKAFQIPTAIKSWKTIFQNMPIPIYDRYHSTIILKYVCENRPPDASKVLIVTELDLFSPIFTCLYGEAQLNGTCSLFSLARLRQEYYNLEPDKKILLSRCAKEAIHEVAHTLGMRHCCDKNCIMYPSTNIIDTDSKSTSFCSNCLKLFNERRVKFEKPANKC